MRNRFISVFFLTTQFSSRSFRLALFGPVRSESDLEVEIPVASGPHWAHAFSDPALESPDG